MTLFKGPSLLPRSHETRYSLKKAPVPYPLIWQISKCHLRGDIKPIPEVFALVIALSRILHAFAYLPSLPGPPSRSHVRYVLPVAAIVRVFP